MYFFRGFCILRFFTVVFALLFQNASCTNSIAAESAVSFYVPGLYGDIGVAIPPSPGTYLLATQIYYPSKAPNSVLPNLVDKRLEGETYAQLLRGYWVPNTTFLGAKTLVGFRISVLDIDISTDIETPLGRSQLNDQNSGIGDLGFIPISLYWQHGNFFINLYEAINVPTGQYDRTRLANIALNHWAFDTVLAMTWLNTKTGIEISAVPGIIYNTENFDTNYQTGIEFHMDAMLNWHFSPSFSVGLHGSIYQQVTGDKGAHPSLGSFKGRSYSIGPAIAWHKDVGTQKYYLSAKWLHEFDAENKIEGDLTMFSVGFKF